MRYLKTCIGLCVRYMLKLLKINHLSIINAYNLNYAHATINCGRIIATCIHMVFISIRSFILSGLVITLDDSSPCMLVLTTRKNANFIYICIYVIYRT